MTTLLDVNVLIALIDAAHIHHAAAWRFFLGLKHHGWATCPITENAVLRILGRPMMDHGPASPAAARVLLQRMLAIPGHQFWPDDLSLADPRFFPSLPASKDLTDLYLLGLAVKHGGCFATFDTNIDPSIIPGGTAAYQLVPVA